MLKIRLQRTGKKNAPSYRVVVIEHTRGTNSGNFIERLGSHNPRLKETQLNADRIKYWLSVGAQASGTVHNLLVSEGIIKADKINVLPKKTPIVKEAEPEESSSNEAAEDKEDKAEGKEEASEEEKDEAGEAPAEEDKKEE